MKQNFRRVGFILSVFVLALMTVCFFSCSALALNTKPSKISFTLPGASGSRSAFGPEVISRYYVGINSDSTGEQVFTKEADSGETIEAELQEGSYSVIIFAIGESQEENGEPILPPMGIGKQSNVKVIPAETTPVTIRIVPLNLELGELEAFAMPGNTAWTYTELPSVTSSGYIFNGWHTADNTPITEFPDTTNLTELTLSAEWIKEGVGDHNASGEYFISVTSVSDDETWHSGKWEDPIPLNQLPDYLQDGKIPSGTILFLQSDLSGLSSLNALFNVIQEGVVFDGNGHTITLGSISLSLPISCDYFIRNLTITSGTSTKSLPLFSITSSGSLKLYECTISNFASSGSTGGAVYNQGRLEFGKSTIDGCSAASGGGIYCASGSFLSIYEAAIKNCTCTGNGASIYLEQNVAVNENSYITSSNCWLDSEVTTSTVFDINSFQGQQASLNDLIAACEAGNILYLNSDEYVIKEQIVINKNITLAAETGRTVKIVRSSELNARYAMFNVSGGCTLTLNEGENSGILDINGNNVNCQNALIYTSGNLVINRNTYIQDNNNTGTNEGNATSGFVAGGIGGSADSIITINGGYIRNNHGSSGGGIMTLGSVIMNDGEISGNTTTSMAGGVFVRGTASYFKGGVITNNTSDNRGGGICAGVGAGKVFMMGTDVKNNKTECNTSSTLGGGGLFGYGGTFYIFKGTFTGNTDGCTGSCGGAIGSSSGTFYIVTDAAYSGPIIIRDNTCTESGKGNIGCTISVYDTCTVDETTGTATLGSRTGSVSATDDAVVYNEN